VKDEGTVTTGSRSHGLSRRRPAAAPGGLATLLLATAVASLAACGGGSKPSPSVSASAKGHYAVKVTNQEGKIGNVVPSPPAPPGAKPDPDTENMGGADANTSVIPLGNGRYQLIIQNTSRVGYIDSVLWQPPPGATVASVSGSTVGSCDVATGGDISCNGLHLKPPKCLCLPGGEATVTFVMHGSSPDSSPHTTGIAGSGLEITSMTPILGNIPSSLGQAPSGNT
jgi:hypothetical protein